MSYFFTGKLQGCHPYIMAHLPIFLNKGFENIQVSTIIGDTVFQHHKTFGMLCLSGPA